MKNQDSDHNPKSLRISIDSKAKVKIGNLSRGGKARTLEPKQADDHDMTAILNSERFDDVSAITRIIKIC